MGKERLPLRVDPETKDALGEYADEQDVSNSEAGRRMLRAGLSQNGYEIAAADGMDTGQLEELRHELSEIEQRQAEYSKHRRMADLRQTVTLVTGAVYIGATVTLGMSGPVWIATGVLAIIAIAVTGWHRTKAASRDRGDQ